MKRSKKLMGLLMFLCVLCAGTVLLTQWEESKEQIRAAGEIVLAVPAEEVQWVRWTRDGTELAFHKESEAVWLYDGDETFPVDGEAVLKKLELFAQFGVSFIIEEATDYGMYGLDDPECVIEFATAAQTYTVSVGDESRMDEERYVSIGDGNVYLAKIDPMDEFDAELDDMICHDESLSYDQIEQITFSGAENYTIFREEDSEHAVMDGDVYFTERDGKTVPLDTDRVETYLESLTTLRLTEYVTYCATEEELEACDLAAPELTITVDYLDKNGDAQRYTLAVSRDPEERAAAQQAEENGEEPEDVNACVRVGDSQIIYRISAYDSDRLRAASYNELRCREVMEAAFAEVTQIDVTLEGTTYTFLADGVDKEKERVWKYGEEEISITGLQKELEALRVEYAADFTEEAPAGKREISLTLHLESETRPTVRLDLYRQDGTYCLAVVDGESLALIPRSDVVEVMETVRAIVL